MNLEARRALLALAAFATVGGATIALPATAHAAATWTATTADDDDDDDRRDDDDDRPSGGVDTGKGGTSDDDDDDRGDDDDDDRPSGGVETGKGGTQDDDDDDRPSGGVDTGMGGTADVRFISAEEGTSAWVPLGIAGMAGVGAATGLVVLARRRQGAES
ncbi:hypothetical protein GT755_05200 [Herbidospora sp. NEAU-GS84]|uniref:LPXTG cell wall anchor domain-containing protein n=1 Tax=Herbidospora solisilvae TaxID=2696284 RepID=A0A7C9JBY7_9ACTN|nr:hypothetical protein [Herbidospora solisilvae]NAS21083.1 hypothetical protein [Herbidospora solisilvae]